MRPDRLVLFTGTGTEIGKTWIAARVLEGLRARGFEVAARKPVQSFAPGGGPRDSELLAAAAGCAADRVCPGHRSYPVPLAPPIAAERLGLDPFTIEDLAEELDLPPSGIAIVEGAGAWRSPLAADGDTRALARRLEPDLVVLVTEARLGAIHAVRACLDTLREWPVAVFLNRHDGADPVAATNLAWLRDRDGVDAVVDVPQLLERVAGDAA